MNRRKSKARAKYLAAHPYLKPGPSPFPGKGRSRTPRGRNGRFSMRRIRIVHNKRLDFTYESSDPWTWSATQHPPMITRRKNRIANRVARRNRKINHRRMH